MNERTARLVLLVGGTAAALVALEIGVRALDLPPRPLAPLPIPSYRISENPVIGFEYRPGYRPETEKATPWHEGYPMNAAGFRDQEFELSKPVGTYRVAVLGDSTTVGVGIQDLANVYTEILEKRLNESAKQGTRYEVMNFGVAGYHTLQEVETLRVKGLKYRPDFVLVTFCVNDFDPYGLGDVYKRVRETYELNSAGDYSGLYHSALRRSRLLFFVHHRLRASDTDYDHWYEASVLKGRSTVEAGLELLSDLQHEYGFRAVFAILPEFRAPFDSYQSHEIHERVRLAADGLSGIEVVDLLYPFRELGVDARSLSFDRALHMNETGHAALAEILLPIVLTD